MEQHTVETSATELNAVQECAILFPGYSSLRQGLAQSLHDNHREVQELFEEAAHITELNMSRLIFSAPESEMRYLPDAYLLLFLLHASAVAYCRTQNMTIVAVGGAGMGAYSALYTAHAYTFADGLYMLSKWGSAYNELLQSTNFKKIQVTGVTYKELQKLLIKQDSSEIAISEIITGSSCALSGMRSVVEAFEEKILSKKADVVITELPLEAGLYAPFASESVANFRQYLEKVEFQDTDIACFAPQENRDLILAPEIKEFVAEQPFLLQDHVQLLERYSKFDTIVIPFADDALLAQVTLRYPEKNIITLL